MSIEPSGFGEEMDCTEMERSIDAYLDHEFDESDLALANTHLANCTHCRGMVEVQGRARALLRAKLRAAMGPGVLGGCAPAELRQRVVIALARQRKPIWRRALAPVPMASLAACAAGVVVVLAIHGGNNPFIEEAIVKHNRDMPLEVAQTEKDAVDQFRSWLDFNPHLPRFQNPAVHFVGARRTYLKNVPAAYMRYDLPHGSAGGLFIFDDPDRTFGEAGRSIQLGPAKVRVFNSRGYNVVVWRRNEIVYSLVSDLDEDDLVQLVGTAAER